jgi:hypothetical protein
MTDKTEGKKSCDNCTGENCSGVIFRDNICSDYQSFSPAEEEKIEANGYDSNGELIQYKITGGTKESKKDDFVQRINELNKDINTSIEKIKSKKSPEEWEERFNKLTLCDSGNCVNKGSRMCPDNCWDKDQYDTIKQFIHTEITEAYQRGRKDEAQLYACGIDINKIPLKLELEK